jgi:hypothetical protein
MKRIQLGRRSPTVVTLWHIAEALGGEAPIVLSREEATPPAASARSSLDRAPILAVARSDDAVTKEQPGFL